MTQRAAALRTAINTHSKTTLNAMMGKGSGPTLAPCPLSGWTPTPP